VVKAGSAAFVLAALRVGCRPRVPWVHSAHGWSTQASSSALYTGQSW
jgi:hypothetical protein